MIDCERWVLAEAWLANGLRLNWSSHTRDERMRFDDGRGQWIDGEGSEYYRYVGYGEWEVPRPSPYSQRPYGEDHAPMLSTGSMRHELAHYLIASADQRSKPNFGLTKDDGEAEEQAVAAERVLASIVTAASRVVGLATGARKP